MFNNAFNVCQILFERKSSQIDGKRADITSATVNLLRESLHAQCSHNDEHCHPHLDFEPNETQIVEAACFTRM